MNHATLEFKYVLDPFIGWNLSGNYARIEDACTEIYRTLREKDWYLFRLTTPDKRTVFTVENSIISEYEIFYVVREVINGNSIRWFKTANKINLDAVILDVNRLFLSFDLNENQRRTFEIYNIVSDNTSPICMLYPQVTPLVVFVK